LQNFYKQPEELLASRKWAVDATMMDAEATAQTGWGLLLLWRSQDPESKLK
jgi:hypothetical protein